MTLKINHFKKKISNSSTNLVFFTNDKFKIDNIKKNFSSNEFTYVKDLLRTSDIKKNIFVFEVNSKKKIVLISIKDNLKTSDFENLGAEFYTRINYGKHSEYYINSDTVLGRYDNFLSHFLHGIKLRSYEFNKYKTKKETRIININVVGNKNKPSFQTQLKFKALEEGAFYARDLVSEPGNILHPDEYAKRLSLLRKDGLKVNIFDEKKIKKTWYVLFTRCRYGKC